LNCELIESIESLPDTTITLINVRKYIVKDSIDEIIEKIIYFKQEAYDAHSSVGKFIKMKKNVSKEDSNCGC